MQGFKPQPKFLKNLQPITSPLPQPHLPQVAGFRPNIEVTRTVTKAEWGKGFQKQIPQGFKPHTEPMQRVDQQPTEVRGFTPNKRVVEALDPSIDVVLDPAMRAKRGQRFKTDSQPTLEDENPDDIPVTPAKRGGRLKRFQVESQPTQEDYEEEDEATPPQPLKAKPKPKPNFKASGVHGMCTSEEAQERELGNLLSCFEMDPDLRGKAKLDWAVKTYTRSGAGVEQGDNLRSEEQMEKTLKYLIDNILDVDHNDNPNNYQLPYDKDAHDFLDIFLFLSDRCRAICKDYNIMKPMTSDLYLSTLRLIARFHIVAASQGLEFVGFDPKPNSDRLQDVLSTLSSLYQYRRGAGMDCPGEDEMLHFSMLLHLPRPLEFHRLLHIADDQGFSDDFALQCFVALQTHDFVGFFAVFHKADYLSACLLQQHFDLVRTNALRSLMKAYTSLELEVVMRLLSLDDQEFAFEYLSFRGMCFVEDRVCMVNFKESELLEEKFKPTQPELQVENKRSDRLRKEVLEESFVLPKLEQTEATAAIKAAAAAIPKPKPKVIEMKMTPIKPLTKAPSTQEAPAVSAPPQAKLHIELDQRPTEAKVQAPSPMPQIIVPPQQPQAEPAKQEPQKAVSKPNIYTFPSETKDLLKLCEDDASRKLFKTAVKTYRRQIKLRTGHKLGTETHQRLKIWFRRWLRQTTLHAYSEYIDKRYAQEIETFKSQFNAPSITTKTRVMPVKTHLDELAELLQPLEHFVKLCICCETSSMQRTRDILGLAHSKLILKTKPEDGLGADLLVVVYQSPDYLAQFTHRYPKAVLLCIDSEPGHFNAGEVYPYTMSAWQWESNMTPITFWEYLIKPNLLKSFNKPWHSLTTLSFEELPGLYQVWFEGLTYEERLELGGTDYASAKLWVALLNKFADGLYNSCYIVAEYPPAPEIFPKLDFSLLGNFDEASRGLNWLRFEELPDESELPELCCELVDWFLEYFSNSCRVYKEFESILSRSTIFKVKAPSNVKESVIVGPWSLLFCTALSAKLSRLERLPGRWLQGRK